MGQRFRCGETRRPDIVASRTGELGGAADAGWQQTGTRRLDPAGDRGGRSCRIGREDERGKCSISKRNRDRSWRSTDFGRRSIGECC